MKKYILTFLLFFIAAATNAQDFRHKPPNEFRFGLHILTGYQFGHLIKLNNQLTSNNFDEINSNFLNLGTGLFFGFNRHSIDIHGRLYGNFEETEFNELGNKASHFGYAVGLNYGFDFYLGGFTITPNIGFRRDFFNLDLLNQMAIKDGFKNSLNTLNSSKLTSEVFGMNFGTKILFEHDSESFNPGLEIGYTFPLTGNWHISDIELLNGPKINSAGFRIGIILQFYLKNYVD